MTSTDVTTTDRGAASTDDPVLALDRVGKTFTRGGRRTAAVADVSLRVDAHETVGLIGESGSGKSTLGRLALMLLRPDTGSVRFEGEELTALKAREMRTRRSRLQIVFQEPAESLDPQMTVAESIAEPLAVQRPRIPADERERRVREALEMVRLDPELGGRYPTQLSGGQQQRVGIARAIITRPSLIVLDEPTSSLDLSVRAGIISLLQTLQETLEVAYLFISHDLSTVAYLADRLVVMYGGRVVESGPTADLIAAPAHPYTRALVDARLDTDPRVRPAPAPATPVGAVMPSHTGCPYQHRCPLVADDCRVEAVPLMAVQTGREAACLHPLGFEKASSDEYIRH